MTRPLLGEIELQHVQTVESDGEQASVQHQVPALEGDYLQPLGYRAARVALNGVLTGPQAGEGLDTLRQKFMAAEPVSFVADLTSATSVGEVLIEAIEVTEIAGKPERFAYAFQLREFIPPPPVTEEAPPEIETPESPAAQIDQGVGTLIVDVTAVDRPDFDFSLVAVTARGTLEDGTSVSRTLANREQNVWTEEDFPGGEFAIEATASSSATVTGSVLATVQPGTTATAQISLRSGSVVAKMFIVHYRFDSAFVEPCMRKVLKQAEQYARDHRSEKLLIVGHTDRAGSSSYNQSLSERRARGVFAYLTVGTDETAALREWNELRQTRPSGQTTSIKDSWGIREYQHILQDHEKRFYPGNVDGQDGPLTREAVRAFRCHKGLPPGTDVDDEVWQALIEDYLKQQPLSVPASQFFPNCPGEILKWLGCGEEDPRDRKGTAHRPSRRTELLFVQTNSLPCEVPQPDTFNLPEPGVVNSAWCLGPGSATAHGCFVSPHLIPGTNNPQPCPTDPAGPWCRQPAQPGSIEVQVSIQREQPDGSRRPATNQQFVLITPIGQFKKSESTSGNPVPERTTGSSDPNPGTFRFPDSPVGVYELQVITDAANPVLVRLRDADDGTIKGNVVCKELTTADSQLNVVIVNAPVMREIRLPVVAHLMTALHPVTREIRICPDPGGGPPGQQRTILTDAQVRAAFDAANDIWRQGRVRFELTDIVREVYAFRVECEVDQNEFVTLLDRCSYKAAVNVFFFGDLAGNGEAGFGVSIEGGAVENVAGCAVGDRFQSTLLGLPLSVQLDDEQRAQVLAHELGHYLNLDHAENNAVNSTRLMLPGTISGNNRTLVSDEVNTARSSRAATDDCVPLTLKIEGATRVGGSLSDRFIFVRNPQLLDPFPITIDAAIPDRLLTVGTLTMAGGTAGSSDRQRLVSKTSTGVSEIVATYTPAGGAPVSARVVILVATFELRVNGAARVGNASSTVFAATRDSTQLATISAVLDPSPFCVPDTLITWNQGTETPDPFRRTVVRSTIASTTVSATIAGETRSVTINVFEIALTNNVAPFDARIAQARIEGVLNSARASFDIGDLFGTQRNSVFRARVDIPGVAGNTIDVTLISNPSVGPTIENVGLTLTRTVGNRFVSLPLLAIPAIMRGQVTLATPQNIEIVHALAAGSLRLIVDQANIGRHSLDLPVRGMVVHVFAQTFNGSGVSVADVRRHIAIANRAWAQAGIEVRERSVASVAAPAGLLELDHTVPFSPVLTAEERRLVGINAGGPARSATQRDVNIYYVETINGPAAGVAYNHEGQPEVSDPNQSAIAIEIPDSRPADDSDTIFAHELGHMLLINWGGNEHQDHSGTDWPEHTILHPSVTVQRDLDRTQVENILLSTRLGNQPFIVFEP